MTTLHCCAWTFDATVLGLSRQSFLSTRSHPALTSFADEYCRMFARLMVYVGTLALLTIAAINSLDRLPGCRAIESYAQPSWNVVLRLYPALALSLIFF